MMTDKSMDFLEKQGSSATKALEVLREELPLQRFVGESLSQAVVEGEVALPGGLREETTVLSAEAMAVEASTLGTRPPVRPSSEQASLPAISRQVPPSM